MDQSKIGNFISTERKNKKLTQKELSEKLNISEKTISKWECGKGLPEVSFNETIFIKKVEVLSFTLQKNIY